MMGESAPIQRWVQLAGYALIVGAALMVLSPFLVPLAWAAILAFATWRPYERVRRGLGGRSALAGPLLPPPEGFPGAFPPGAMRFTLAPPTRPPVVALPPAALPPAPGSLRRRRETPPH